MSRGLSQAAVCYNYYRRLGERESYRYTGLPEWNLYPAILSEVEIRRIVREELESLFGSETVDGFKPKEDTT